jgi:hypothetical protein
VLPMQAKTLATLAGAEKRKSERIEGNGVLIIALVCCTCICSAALLHVDQPNMHCYSMLAQLRLDSALATPGQRA